MSNQNFGGQKPVYSQSFSRSGPRRDGPPRRDNQGGRNFQNSFEPGDDNDVIQVDSRKLGCIIGTKGSNIRKMESDSGAEIQVRLLRFPEYHICFSYQHAFDLLP